jgi:hypothetical protein
VFDTVVIETAKSDNVINFFIETYGFSGSAARDAVGMFVYLAKKSGIKVSESLAAPSNPQGSAPPDRTPRTKIRHQDLSGGQSVEEPKAKDIEELRLGQIRIWLPKGDANAAESAKNLIDLYLKTLS